ncbi:MAG: hypothetical protein JST73_08360 [Actinobacteria bacterium]|nr:hypothetical protein [Actinomycetota bacterium]
MAVVVIVLVMVAMFVGCAKYDGDQAAFCAQLKTAPSFMHLAGEVGDGSAAHASAVVGAGAKQFRSLERVAPRSIRANVAALGDAAERISHRLAHGTPEPTIVRIVGPDGTHRMAPIDQTVSQERLGAFYVEMQSHHGTLSAVYSLSTYATAHCGMTENQLDLGMAGFGPSGPSTNGTFSGFEGGPATSVVPGVPRDGPSMPSTPGP